MLTASSSSSRSKSTLTDSSSLLANVDLEIVERIFERGKYATSFPQIFRPYTEVLQEYDISPTNDSTYYGFLLKVGVIKAATWGDKWSIWKATHSTSIISPQESLLENENSIKTTELSSNRSFSKSQLPLLRARVPFLASASSDIDEGFAPSIKDDIHGNEKEDSYTEEGSLTLGNRPSPRKELSRSHSSQSRNRMSYDSHRKNTSRSLVGYTPEQSFEITNESLDFDPPMRTSTPIYRSPKYNNSRLINQNPPEYSVSDLSQTIEDFSALGLSTPKGKNTYSPKLPPLTSQSTWINKIDDISEGDRRYMEKKADEFYKLGLMGRCWDMWFKTSEFYRVTYKNIPVARDNLLLRQVLDKWSKATQYQLSLPGTADRHRQLSLKVSILRRWTKKLKEKRLSGLETLWVEERQLKELEELFGVWKNGTDRRRTEKWKLDMANKELYFVQTRDEIILRKSLMHWRIEARGKLAESDREKLILQEAFEDWHYLAAKKRDLGAILVQVQTGKLRHSFEVWRRKSVLKPKEDDFKEACDLGLVKRVWNDWRISSWQAKQSSTFDRRRLLLMTIDKWKTAEQNQKLMERKALIYDKTRLLDKAFRGWKLGSWGKLLFQAKEKRLQEKVWQKWHNKQDGLVQLNNLVDQFVEKRESRKLHNIFSRWRSFTSTRHADQLRAVLIYEQNLQINTLSKWYNSTQIIKTNRGLADKAHAFFLLRTAFKVWRAEQARRNAERWVEVREQETIKNVFSKWRMLSCKYGNLKKAEVVLKDLLEKQSLRNALAKWTHRVIEVKDRELRVSRARDEQTMSQSLMRWRGRLSIIESNRKKADDTLEIRESENLRRIFRFWRGNAKRQKRLRMTANNSLIERDQKLVRSVFEKWYEKKRELELQDIEKEVAFLHENVVLYGVMDKWKAGTQVLPGITANSLRLKRKALHKWFIALERKRRAGELQSERGRKLLSEAFELWRDATVHKAALNARKMRGRSRPSTISDRRTSLGTHLPFSLEKLSSSGNRRITPTSPNFPINNNPAYRTRIDERGRLSPNLNAGNGMSIGDRDNETVHSEPVYSRLRTELGNHEQKKKPRSGSEMLRALKGNIPGR
ncbi:uncharacterized protein L201_006590 [Kwoniella dendrophila CBS 6074]|uniref:Sfi1 spindle body domain-containing protein n=1 Tax=Kwoniella dendrophila CBS 6074 TaxID=1295534 RepID=A0AAX4K3G8_9TREE